MLDSCRLPLDPDSTISSVNIGRFHETASGELLDGFLLDCTADGDGNPEAVAGGFLHPPFALTMARGTSPSKGGLFQSMHHRCNEHWAKACNKHWAKASKGGLFLSLSLPLSPSLSLPPSPSQYLSHHPSLYLTTSAQNALDARVSKHEGKNVRGHVQGTMTR